MGLEKATIKYGKEFKEEIKVLFNPSEYTISTTNSYESKMAPGTDNAVLQFKKGGISELTMNLYFDTYTQTNLNKDTLNKLSMDPIQTIKDIIKDEKEDVRTYTQKITKLMEIDPETHCPHVVIFAWGSLSFKAVIESVTETYTMFLPNGKPVRARLTVKFKEAKGTVERARKNVLHSPDRTKQRTVMGVDQLWHIADQEYDDPSMWRIIARENGILNPRKVQHGTVLKVPSIT